MKQFSIRALSRLSGVLPHTLRIWELRYGLPVPLRTASGIRYYSVEEAETLMESALLCRNGYRISAVARMSADERRAILKGLADSEAMLEYLRIQLTGMLYRSDTVLFDDTLRRARSFPEGLLVDMLVSLVDRARIDGVNPAIEERWLLERVRQRLCCWIEAMPPPQPGATSFTLFLPAGAPPDLVLLWCGGRLRAAGCSVTWLGSGVALKELRELCARQASVLLTYFPVAGLQALAGLEGQQIRTLEGRAQRGMPSVSSAQSVLESLAPIPFVSLN